jgi:periplasmic divalent cation tolerance protein
MKTDAQNVVIFITTAAGEEAHTIANILLQHRKVACVNIIAGVSSLFWWNGKIDAAEESLLVAKTTASHIDDFVRLVKESHGYDIPEVIAFPIVGGNLDYLEWMDREVS